MTERNLQGFATIPRAVLHDPTIPADAKVVYLVLSSHVGDQSGDVWPSHSTIATDASLSTSTVKRQLLFLRSRGLIEWTNHVAPGTSCKTINTYRLIAETATPQQLPIAQPEPTSTQTLGSHRAIGKSRSLTGNVGSGRATNESTKNKNKDQKSPTDSSANPRKIDPLFEAMIEVCGINRDELTEAQRGSLNGALKQLRDVGATGDDIHERARRYVTQMPQARLTPPALAKHWPTLGRPLRTVVADSRPAYAR